MIEDKSEDESTRREAEDLASHEAVVGWMQMTTDEKLLKLRSKVRELESRVERLETPKK